MSLEKRKELTDKGVTVITATHALSGAERGIANRYGGVTPAILWQTHLNSWARA
jgi:hypothetical protein